MGGPRYVSGCPGDEVGRRGKKGGPSSPRMGEGEVKVGRAWPPG